MNEIKTRVEDGICFLSIDRPKALNALSRDIVDQLDVVIEDIKNNPEIRALIIHNDGNFAAGADIADMVECNEEAAKAFGFSPTFNKIANLSIPTIAVIEGYALGGGMELALTCDLRIAVDNAKMGFPEITLGIMPGAGGTVRLPRLIGLSKAKEMILMGGSIGADKALEYGLVNAVLPKEEAMELALKWAGKFKKLSAVAIKIAKNTLDEAYDIPKEEAVELEAANWAGMFNTEDQKEGMRAFLEKRKPSFIGK